MTDVIARLNNALGGPYAIEGELGEGRMVAVVGAERFLAEIQVTANLQHPHILPLFDLRDSEPVVVDFGITLAIGAAVSPPL